jgi:nucleoside phosphorylase
MPAETTVLDRIAFRPSAQELAPIPWPEGMAPEAQQFSLSGDGALPQADILVITWTEAEGMAAADVLTPGRKLTSWANYTRDFSAYVHMLTDRSPARESRRLGRVQYTRINDKIVCCLKSELHPATDGIELPTAKLVGQALNDTRARLVITTGTAGGAGDGTQLGDVCLASQVHSDFTTRLKGQPWSTERWPCAALTGKQTQRLEDTAALFAANAGHLPPLYVKRACRTLHGHVVSTDFFAYDTGNDHFGLRAYDPDIKAVEMDDAAVAFGASQMSSPVPVASVRNASDPVMPDASEESARTAEEIYRQFGYWTTVNSAIVTWALCAGA